MIESVELPAELAVIVGEGTWTRLSDTSPTLGWRVERPSGADLVVRRDRPHSRTDSVSVHVHGTVADQVERLTWAAGPMADEGFELPEVVAHGIGADGVDVLVTTMPVGENDLRLMPTGDDPLRVLGETLQRLHNVDTSGCPFVVDSDRLIEHVTARVAAGEIVISDLHEAYRRSTPERLVEHLHTMQPIPLEPGEAVLVHGSLSVRHLVVDPSMARVVGILGWEWSGLGDRLLDLAVTARSVMMNFGPEASAGLFDVYGIDVVDPLRLEFYGLTDELR